MHLTMAAMKRSGSAQRILFVMFLVALAALQFESLMKVSRQIETITTIELPSHHHHESPLPTSNDNDATSSCLHILGKNGTWVQDWQFAKNYGQYSDPLVIPPGPHVKRTWGKFRPSADAPFRWESSWRWHDYAPNGCQIDYTVSSNKLCEVLHSLQVTRVLFFGDSLSQSMAKSLLNKLGTEHVTAKSKPSSTTESYQIQCPRFSNNVQFLLAKEGGGHGSRSNPTRFDFVMTNVTRHFISSNPDRTLAVLNFGAHYHAMHEYEEDLDILLHTMDRFQRPNDLIFFRTTVPGHKHCTPSNPRRFNWTQGLREVPLKRFEDYRITTQYSWDLFFKYNRHVKQTLEERAEEKPTIHLLDVEHMTILRQDGHVGGQDCLHYYSPGPVDWWNHLLFTFLKELAASTKRTNDGSSSLIETLREQ